MHVYVLCLVAHTDAKLRRVSGGWVEPLLQTLVELECAGCALLERCEDLRHTGAAPC